MIKNVGTGAHSNKVPFRLSTRNVKLVVSPIY